MTASADSPANNLLASLSAADRERLAPHLTPVDLKLRYKLEQPNKPITDLYFLHSGIASVVAPHADKDLEIGLIGREGATGAAVMLGGGQTPHATYMQVAGAGEKISVAALRKAAGESETLNGVLLRYVHVFMVQTAHTATANGRASLAQRLARWLLMAQDRTGGGTLPLTHEFLGMMVGVRRAGVTEALQVLKRRRLIRPERGAIAVLNRAGLERLAGVFYGAPEREYERLIGKTGLYGFGQ